MDNKIILEACCMLSMLHIKNLVNISINHEK